ncbi:MAG: SDR family oxidoreductase [Rubrivivax sp.]|nr:SDR family oxidoreductase [Rubrivivax sp.]
MPALSPAPQAPAAGNTAAAAPVVLVTGAAQRIGRAIALELAAAGWRVAVHYRHSAGPAQALVQHLNAVARPGLPLPLPREPRSAAFCADLADEAACRALVPAVVREMGRIDALVNNASLFEHDNAADFSFAAMERHWRANTGAPLLLAQALHEARGHAPPRHEGGSAVVVNLLDQKLWAINPDHLSYTLSKAALEVATRMLAMTFAPHTRVCGVAPGITLTSSEMSAAEFDTAHRMTPLGRGASADEIARAVRFLVESPSITGTTLLVDGGQHLAGQARDVVFLAREVLPAPPR